MVPARGVRKTSLWKSRLWSSSLFFFLPLLPFLFGEIIRKSRGTISFHRDSRSSLAFPLDRTRQSVSKQLRISMEMSSHDSSIDYLFIAPWPLQRMINSIGQKSAAEPSPFLSFFFWKRLRWNRTKFPN